MTRTRKELADTIDAYDLGIAQMQESKREAYQDYRRQLSQVMGESDVKSEVEAFKLALKRRNAIMKQGKMAVEEKDALVKEILGEITGTPLATRVARRARTNVHGPEAANIIEPVVTGPAGAQLNGEDTEATDVLDAKSELKVSAGKQGAAVSPNREPAQGEASRPGDSTGTVEAHSVHDGRLDDLQQRQTSTTIASRSATEAVADVTDHSVRGFKSGPIRPNCLNPTLCASPGGRVHCHKCNTAHKAREA